ncbi:MAG: hypothetical protein CW336_01235 [Bacteroidetes bacterium]|jgi:hypothetical protein|nr:hypothetical protein [Bacteroidota bacterium]
MENNNENNMTAQQSFSIITEMVNNSRRSILQNSAKHFLLWGALLTIMSLVIYETIHITRNPIWNLLWFAMPLIGFPMAHFIGRNKVEVPQNIISKQLHGVWLAYCAFVVVISAVFMFIAPQNLTLVIIMAFGFAECVSGIILKNWSVIVSGFILGVGGAIAAIMLRSEAQLLLFTLCGVILVVTGLIVKSQYK